MRMTPERLKQMAGWAISMRHRSSDAQVLALCKFKDGCEALVEDFPENQSHPATGGREVTACHLESPVRAGRVTIGRQEISSVVRSIERGVAVCQEGGEHRFDIRTQQCVWCGKSYREAHGRKPELM